MAIKSAELSNPDNYVYDANGNMQQDLANGIGFVLYDMHNLPVTLYKTNGTQYQFACDAQGNRVRKAQGTATYPMYFNGADGKAEVVTPSFIASTYNIWGSDMLGQVKRTSSTWNRYYYLKDHLGNIRVTVDGSGNVTGADDYYPFGMQMEGRSIVGGADARFKFISEELDAEFAMYQLGPRWYDQRIGVFRNTDPLNQYDSPYNYSGSNPVNFSDPSGLWATGYTEYVVATQYFNEHGKMVYDDGVDNGLEVYTTQEIIDANTSDGVTNWDAVRNDARSTVKIVDDKKYWGWAGQVQDAIIAAHDGAARVSVDNKGNVTVSTPMGFWQMTGLMLGPLAASELIGAYLGTGIKATAHGAKRIAGATATRGGVLTQSEIIAVKSGGRIMTQADGATVRILETGGGKSNVVIEGSKGIITTFKGLSQSAISRLAKNYGWR